MLTGVVRQLSDREVEALQTHQVPKQNSSEDVTTALKNLTEEEAASKSAAELGRTGTYTFSGASWATGGDIDQKDTANTVTINKPVPVPRIAEILANYKARKCFQLWIYVPDIGKYQ
ncbi:unnamed protein product [Echinostoma caproni]|uniref:Adhesin n=1 Tax=Echinostoma caproni TaxID=27848 RepID=A0A183B6A5_9TREM|nr:unnamed protein product [Echinostoma caproni]